MAVPRRQSPSVGLSANLTSGSALGVWVESLGALFLIFPFLLCGERQEAREERRLQREAREEDAERVGTA